MFLDLAQTSELAKLMATTNGTTMKSLLDSKGLTPKPIIYLDSCT